MNLVKNEYYDNTTRLDDWEKLKQFTDARIAIGRAGCSIPTKAMLEFQLAHAQARDAVYQPLDNEQIQQRLNQLGLESLMVHSQASDKEEYLKRPDLGRLLSEESKIMLLDYANSNSDDYDICIVIGDGLSALAIEENAVAFIQSIQEQVKAMQWKLAPIIIAEGSRVALGDEVAERLKAKMLVMLIGERPGLSSPDSMGIYYTWEAKSGCLDSKRNCISNVRSAGLSYLIATQRLMHLMQKSFELKLSGVNLKDDHVIETVEHQVQLKRLF